MLFNNFSVFFTVRFLTRKIQRVAIHRILLLSAFQLRKHWLANSMLCIKVKHSKAYCFLSIILNLLLVWSYFY